MEEYKEFYRFAKHFPAGLSKLYTVKKEQPVQKKQHHKKEEKGKKGVSAAAVATATDATTTAAGPSVNDLRERLQKKISESKRSSGGGKHADRP